MSKSAVETPTSGDGVLLFFRCTHILYTVGFINYKLNEKIHSSHNITKGRPRHHRH